MASDADKRSCFARARQPFATDLGSMATPAIVTVVARARPDLNLVRSWLEAYLDAGHHWPKNCVHHVGDFACPV
jgi:hypothetical protein